MQAAAVPADLDEPSMRVPEQPSGIAGTAEPRPRRWPRRALAEPARRTGVFRSRSFERPPWLYELDPYQPIDALRSCRTTGPHASRSAVTKLPFVACGARPEADIRFAIYILLSLNPENGESNLQGLPPDRLTKFLSDVRDKDLCKHLLQSELHVTIRLPVHA